MTLEGVTLRGEYLGRRLNSRHDRHWVNWLVTGHGQKPVRIKVQIGLDSRGRLAIFGLVGDDEPITELLVRRLPLTKIAQQSARLVRRQGDRDARATGQAASMLRDHRHEGITDDFLAAVAATCKAALAEGESTYEAIAKALPGQSSKATITRWIDRARKRFAETGDERFDPGPSRKAKVQPKTTRKRGGTQKGQRKNDK